MNTKTEITQNQSPSEVIREEVEGDVIITYKRSGDFVVCNLSSINLGRAHDVLDRLIPIQVRMLDNVIDINTLPVKQAIITNQKYRAVGIGTFGWHYLLAKKGIQWESQEAVDYTNVLYEEIAFRTIKASMELAVDKGAYPLFEGSEWSTGEYFERKDYEGIEWKALKYDVAKNGIRNGYLMAVAPNTMTAKIAGSTASIDPIYDVVYDTEDSSGKYPVAAPELDHNTYDVYRRTAYKVDQRMSVEQNIARQRHIDQAISFNIYVPNTIKASALLGLHLQAWGGGMKTTYYVRSSSDDIEGCEWCES